MKKVGQVNTPDQSYSSAGSNHIEQVGKILQTVNSGKSRSLNLKLQSSDGTKLDMDYNQDGSFKHKIFSWMDRNIHWTIVILVFLMGLIFYCGVAANQRYRVNIKIEDFVKWTCNLTIEVCP
jgi:hypothetical protein